MQRVIIGRRSHGRAEALAGEHLAVAAEAALLCMARGAKPSGDALALGLGQRTFPVPCRAGAVRLAGREEAGQILPQPRQLRVHYAACMCSHTKSGFKGGNGTQVCANA